MSNVRQNLRPRTEKVSVPLVQTIPLVGIFLAAFSNLLVGIPLVGMCRRVVYMYTCAVEKNPQKEKCACRERRMDTKAKSKRKE